uniref:leucine-rich repeat neuronal protein 4-like n=1 Tax=Pristiophorus japonicus TaxID=55135 RepID=UPI00398F2E16
MPKERGEVVSDVIGVKLQQHLCMLLDSLTLGSCKPASGLGALEILDLSHNNLTNEGLPCGSLNIATLRHLNTASNQLTTVPSCLPAALEFLDLSKNVIQQIEFSEFTGLQNLNDLLLSHNKISTIVSSGTVLPHLASLDLSYNNFTKLQWKFQMPNLTMLRLEGNPMQQISPCEFSLFPKLHYLNLSMMSLEVCSYKAFASEMENLKVLDLSANLFKTFDPQWFEGLSNLQILWMRQMPFLQSLPADLFVHTPSLIQVDLEENPQLHFVKSSMFEFLLHLEFLSLKSCNLTEFRPWNFFTNSTITVSLSENPLVCSCELTWLISKPEKIQLNRANYTRCHRKGPQREILLTDLINECDINGNHMQELLVDASTAQTQLLEHTTAVFHNSSDIIIKTSSSKLPVQSSARFQFSISTSSLKTTNVLNTLPFHGSSSDSNSATLQTKESSTQNDKNLIKSEMTLETSILPEFSSISTTIKKKGPIFIVIEDDDSESLEEEITNPPHVGDCNYDPCRHWQVPCHDLRHLTGCHCPDITGEDVIPDPVKIQKVIRISDNSAEIYWCAPSSTVLHYYIIFQSDDNRHLYKTDTINPTYRRYTLRDLTSDSTYHTCVVAVNKAGSSTASSIWPSKGPCYIFKTKPNYNNIFYITSTAIIAILFILVIILSICLCRIRQKGRLTDLSRISLNPLSLQNPAFDDHLELADPRSVINADSEQIP